MVRDVPPDLSAAISNADRAGLVLLVRERGPGFSESDVLRCLRHSFASAEMIEELVESGGFLAQRAIRKAVALHPAARRATALRCVEDLPWRDLVDVGRDPRTPFPVRRAANRRILEGVDFLSLGEKVALARLADRALLKPLLGRLPLRSLEALLGNPRLAEEDLVAWVLTGHPTGPQIELLARSSKWMKRRALVGAVLFNPETPRSVALGLLRRASREDWTRLTGTSGVDPLLSACAARLLEENGLDRGDPDVPTYSFRGT